MPNISPVALGDLYNTSDQISSVAYAVSHQLRQAAKAATPDSTLLTVCYAACEWISTQADTCLKDEIDHALMRRPR